MSSARPAASGRYRIVATSVARLTVASVTPGVFRRKRSMRFTQLAPVIPSIGWETVAGVGGRPSLILPRRTPVAATTPDRAERHTGPVPTVHVAAVEAPWGPIQLAAWDAGLLACESLTPFGPFVEGLERRLHVTVSESGHPVLDAAAEQVAAFLDD